MEYTYTHITVLPTYCSLSFFTMPINSTMHIRFWLYPYSHHLMIWQIQFVKPQPISKYLATIQNTPVTHDYANDHVTGNGFSIHVLSGCCCMEGTTSS